MREGVIFEQWGGWKRERIEEVERERVREVEREIERLVIREMMIIRDVERGSNV